MTKRLLRRPLLHFLALGLALFVARSWLPDEPQPLRITEAEVERLRADWLRETGRPPTAAQLQASLEAHQDERRLLREALRLGLDASDPVARERLLMNMRFAFPQTSKDDDALLDEAQRLGMSARDTLVRRRLVQVMEAKLSARAELSEADLLEFARRYPERYGQPVRCAFRHVFFSHEGGGDADAAAAQLAAGELPAGEAFLLGSEFPPQTFDEIARHFGGEFAQAVADAPLRGWIGPVASPYGKHLLQVTARAPAAAPEPAALRRQLAYALLPEAERTALRRELDKLRRRYPAELPRVATRLSALP